MPLQLPAIVYIDVNFQAPLSVPHSTSLSDQCNSEAKGDHIPIILQVVSHNIKFANPYPSWAFKGGRKRKSFSAILSSKQEVRSVTVTHLRISQYSCSYKFLQAGSQYFISCMNCWRSHICFDVSSINKSDICNATNSLSIQSEKIAYKIYPLMGNIMY